MIESTTTMTRACEEETRELRATGASRARAWTGVEWCGVCVRREFTSPPREMMSLLGYVIHPSNSISSRHPRAGKETKQSRKCQSLILYTISKKMSLERDCQDRVIHTCKPHSSMSTIMICSPVLIDGKVGTVPTRFLVCSPVSKSQRYPCSNVV